MAEPQTATPFVPSSTDLDVLRRAARECRGCSLHRHATQTVFGSGPPRARLALVGEQPDFLEDRRGAPFVGFAGTVLRDALLQAGLRREDAYLTHSVKHLKFRHAGAGTRRLPVALEAQEQGACRPWLIAELRAVRPDVIVTLGPNATRSLFSTSLHESSPHESLPHSPLGFQRGGPVAWRCPPPDGESAAAPHAPTWTGALVVASITPASIVHAADQDNAMRILVEDLQIAAQALREPRPDGA